MDKYNIYCTEEQTKNASRLRAPISDAMSKYNARLAVQNIDNGKATYEEYANKGIAIIKGEYVSRALKIPTTEQMIGWLEEQDTYINILWDDSLYSASIFHTDKGKIGINEIFTSRKEATLAAIDAALEYLRKGGKE